MTDRFYESYAWQRIRYSVLRKHGFKCMACGSGASQGAIIQVDHIKPRSKFPDLELSESNLQVLCKTCNMGKSNVYNDDLRPKLAKRNKMRPPFKKRSKTWRRALAATRLSKYIKRKLSESEKENDPEAQCKWMKIYLGTIRKLAKTETEMTEVDRFLRDAEFSKYPASGRD